MAVPKSNMASNPASNPRVNWGAENQQVRQWHLRLLHITAGPPSYSTGFQPACSRKWERRSSLDRVEIAEHSCCLSWVGIELIYRLIDWWALAVGLVLQLVLFCNWFRFVIGFVCICAVCFCNLFVQFVSVGLICKHAFSAHLTFICDIHWTGASLIELGLM